MKLKILDLFSGIGGFSLGLEATGHFETAAFCEIEPYCQKVLKKHWPDVPIFDDIRKLKGTDIGTVDIITGGYPCQPFSVAGKQKAEQDPRHLWPEYFRLIQELRPTWVIGENVSGHIKLGLDSVLEDLASEGYSTRTFSISASSIGANHKRERIWTIANLANTDINGYIQGLTKECNEINSREELQEFWRKSTNKTFRQSDDGRNTEKSRINENLSRSSISRKTYATQSDGVCGISTQSNISQGTISTDTNKENNDRTLVSKGQSRLRLSEHRRLEDHKEASEGNKIRQRDDNIEEKRMEDVEDSGRTLWQRGQFSKENEDEIGKENANQFKRSSGTSKIDVANTDSKRQQEQWRPISVERQRKEGQELECKSWWESEPRVGRVAHGIPKRVDRLKTLGNAVVPHIPYYIGQAIVESYQ